MPRTFEVEIEKLVHGGSGLGRRMGKVVFVPFASPGDRVTVRPVREKKDYILGKITEILTHSPSRTTPPCPYYRKCGGCQLQHIAYTHQVEAKLNILKEALYHRFPYTRGIPVKMEPCLRPFGYRSRARIQLRKSGSNVTVGFFRFESHEIEAIENCLLLRPPLDRALQEIRNTEPAHGISANIKELDIAGSNEENLWTSSPSTTDSSIHVNQTLKIPEQWNPGLLLERKVGDFAYSVAAPVFFQANDFMIERMVELVREMASIEIRDSALELFAGVGLLTLPLANLYKKVTAVENCQTASNLCSGNVSSAGINSVNTICADVSDWLQSCSRHEKAPLDLVLLDPPRSGAGRETMQRIESLEPQTIIYVSCDPQTLLRDLSCLSTEAYSIDRIESLDMFPQTFHFETLVRLVSTKYRRSKVESQKSKNR
ncbi:MAG: class I SAM-dependent RNA methyltransferase [Acidobacteriota bacterium]